ncbi:MAG: VTT domain-containing protein [Desulfitobacteriaceae bacterium]
MIHNIWNKVDLRKYGLIGVLITAFILFIAAFLYLDRRNEISVLIQAWGVWGILLAILLMTALCMTPMPSEGLVVLFLKIFGIYQGIFYSWLGSTLSSLAIFFIARIYGQKLMPKLISSKRFELVDNWIYRKGALGLLIARLLPIPAFAVNYIAGVMPSIKLWPYFWTVALSIVPYYIGTALVFMGVAQKTWLWFFLGAAALFVFWGTGYTLNKRQ